MYLRSIEIEVNSPETCHPSSPIATSCQGGQGFDIPSHNFTFLHQNNTIGISPNPLVNLPGTIHLITIDITMDIIDLSTKCDFPPILKRIQANAERSARRKGERPKDHPSPQCLIADFIAMLYQKEMLAVKTVCTSYVPPPYAPSVRSVNDLQPLMISHMTLETHHR